MAPGPDGVANTVTAGLPGQSHKAGLLGDLRSRPCMRRESVRGCSPAGLLLALIGFEARARAGVGGGLSRRADSPRETRR